MEGLQSYKGMIVRLDRLLGSMAGWDGWSCLVSNWSIPLINLAYRVVGN